MMNKRGQGLSINAVVLIILAVAVLVALVLGFVLGWDKIMPWLKPDNNVAQVAQDCELACSLGNTYDYCSKKMKMFAEEIPDGIEMTCNDFSKDTNYRENYGIKSCPGLCATENPDSTNSE